MILESNIADTAYTTPELAKGSTFKFRLQARNSFGLSAYSEPISLMIGSVPSKPEAPSTSVVGDNVMVQWTAPDDNGSPILSYVIELRQNDLVTFSTELNYCDGSVSAIISSL